MASPLLQSPLWAVHPYRIMTCQDAEITFIYCHRPKSIAGRKNVGRVAAHPVRAGRVFAAGVCARQRYYARAARKTVIDVSAASRLSPVDVPSGPRWIYLVVPGFMAGSGCTPDWGAAWRVDGTGRDGTVRDGTGRTLGRHHRTRAARRRSAAQRGAYFTCTD